MIKLECPLALLGSTIKAPSEVIQRKKRIKKTYIYINTCEKGRYMYVYLTNSHAHAEIKVLNVH